MSEQFSYNTMLSTVGEALENGCQTLDDILTETTNNDLWIIGTYQAAEALAKFDTDDMLYTITNLKGVFGAIEYIKAYENEQFGEVNTNFSDPESVSNMVAYINMSFVLNDLATELDIDYDDDLTSQQVEIIKEYIETRVK